MTALIIIHFGNPEILYRCLKTIIEYLFTNVRVIIVNNSSDNIIFKEKNEILVIKTGQNSGYASACNAGIRKAKELGIKNFVLCNNDVQFTKEFFSLFLPRVKEIGYPVVAAPKINYLDKPNSVWYAGGKVNKFTMEGMHIKNQLNNSFIETEFITGCCFYLSEYTFKLLGPMDENYFLYDEDLDYSLRAKAKGVKLLVYPTVKIYHDESSSAKDPTRIGKYKSEIYFHKLRSKILIIKKYAKFPYTLINWPYVFYKYFKYAILFLIRREFYYAKKIFHVFRTI